MILRESAFQLSVNGSKLATNVVHLRAPCGFLGPIPLRL